MYKAILSLAVCLTTMLVISVTVSAAEYEEIKMDVEYRIENAATYSSDKITYKFNSPYKGLFINGGMLIFICTILKVIALYGTM